MKKLLICLLILTFHLGYLEWGKGNSSFIFQAEAQIFSKAKTGFQNALHPLILIPVIGIVLLLYTLFQPEPNRTLTLVGVVCLGLLMMILLFIGIIDANFKILLSTIPYWTVALVLISRIRKKAHRGM